MLRKPSLPWGCEGGFWFSAFWTMLCWCQAFSMLKLPSCVSCVNRCGQTVGFGVWGGCRSWSALFTAGQPLPSPPQRAQEHRLPWGSPVLPSLPPLLFCHLLPLCLERLTFRRLHGAVTEFFPACGTGKLWGAASSSRQGGPESSALSRLCLWGQGCCSFYEMLLRLLSSFLKISLWTAF